ALGSLRRYDVQAKYAFALAMVSIVPSVAALWMGWRRFDADLGRIIYGSQGRFVLAFVGCVLLSMGPAALGFVMGWSSAGQRRNDQSSRSWIAFFVGGGVLTLNVVLLIAFYMLRLKSQT
ncbi:MAG: hypothetical protein ACREXT_12765, partial [Gammaproteobacteria bacterium]